ncbi:hypothetical protein C8F01DRAFT_1179733 [Mycena amicta]|nr:hypothetical protein C8F01DRAFT_1179733 [Mycena amicta]
MPKTRLPPPPTAPPAPTESVLDDTDPKKQRALAILWDKNPDWTWIAISVLKDDSSLRLKLFSDSTQDANSEGRRKTVGADGKKQLYKAFAKQTFEHNDMVTKHATVAEAYLKDPERYASSLQQRFDRLRKLYREARGKLKETGRGVVPGDGAVNSIAQTREQFKFWDELHSFWSELPNYSPIGVSAADSGVDHAGHAADLFASSTASSDAGDFVLGDDELREIEEDADADQPEDDRSKRRRSSGAFSFSSAVGGSDDGHVDDSKTVCLMMRPPVASKTEKQKDDKDDKDKGKNKDVRSSSAVPKPRERAGGHRGKSAAPGTAKRSAIEIFDDDTKEEAQRIEHIRLDRIKVKRAEQEIELVKVQTKRAKLDAEDREKEREFREKELAMGAQEREKDRLQREKDWQHELTMSLLRQGVGAQELRDMGLLPAIEQTDPFAMLH